MQNPDCSLASIPVLFILKGTSVIIAFSVRNCMKLEMKQPHGRMSTKWAPITGGIQRDGGITGGVPIT